MRNSFYPFPPSVSLSFLIVLASSSHAADHGPHHLWLSLFLISASPTPWRRPVSSVFRPGLHSHRPPCRPILELEEASTSERKYTPPVRAHTRPLWEQAPLPTTPSQNKGAR
ncbi:uncharacterized protein LY79DRAFT_408530 [Colletotrichum navitas]|uniref:Secreted protein n=1 Tax=Colletotrichum navitas TaxID=681940 RepID=A0AAD8Q788_9PEZI|nr:uncharacterized protein LY79DRAFT_408530 [Colletotrichum navitas]KAK1597226.1 hypothetical protein LY79DRAFT_408530 [Colletotrichum navitas]